MAEVLGSVASALALCELVLCLTERAVELYKAPEELTALQEQIQVFSQVVQRVESMNRSSPQETLQYALSHARKALEALHSLLTAKLSKQSHSPGITCRLAWMRNRATIGKLREHLTVSHQVLLAALGAELLSSTRSIESTLSTMCAEATTTSSTTLSIQRRPEAMTVDPSRQLPFLLSRPSLRRARMRLSAIDNSSESEEVEDLETLNDHLNVHRRAEPASYFEKQQCFSPCGYTVDDGVTALFAYSNRDVQVAHYTRTIECGVFYRKIFPHRQWTRLTVTVTLSIESKYWIIGAATPWANISKNNQELPVGLTSHLKSFVESRPELVQDSHLDIFLGGQKDEGDCAQSVKVRIDSAKRSFSAKAYLRRLTNIVRHWDIERYPDKALEHRPVSLGVHFMACLRSRWVQERRFGSGKAHIDLEFNNLHALHCLRGTPGINKLLGTTIDDVGMISGYLVEYPGKGPLFTLINAADNSGEPVSFERRVKWCRQIVEAVAAVHNAGFFVATLPNLPTGAIAINCDDSAILWAPFRSTFTYDNINSGILPPELRESAPLEGAFPANFATDIFQLGALLWQIAEYRTTRLRSEFCKIARCGNQSRPNCDEAHAEPIQLPPVAKGVPDYLNNVISACRTADPAERPAAREIMEMFPQRLSDSSENGVSIGENPPSLHGTTSANSMECVPTLFQRPEECTNMYGPVTVCDIDGRLTSEHSFHCNVCAASDYYICPSCFADGRHCLDPNHYLQERRVGWKGGKYHSNVKENGLREVLDL